MIVTLRIVHSGKLSNIFIDERAEAHASDFGLAKLLDDGETRHHFCCKPFWGRKRDVVYRIVGRKKASSSVLYL